ncbi:hypothetical protein BKA66DRAFT_564952 [Pyrenochaeta sp. MPI-SDFR-AT-0127]|nr:hypothetical protein BKA66DRAFT_564952 [Pyrenochaeta sp. MPI-SDFR-AT-0127]
MSSESRSDTASSPSYESASVSASPSIATSIESRGEWAFCPAKWSLLDPLPEPQIVGVDARGEPPLQPFFEGGPDTAAANGAATEPPNSRLHILIEPLNSWWPWHDKRHLKTAPGLIEYTDGQQISVKQFMRAVHDYVTPK